MLNLPKQAALKVLELSKSDRNFVHVHIDSKTASPDRRDRGFERRDGKKDRDSKSYSSRHTKERGRLNPHVSVERTGSAGLYKKKKK